MKLKPSVFIQTLLLSSIVSLLLLSEGWAQKPTLARLYFKVQPERMAEFEAAYRARLLPVFEKYEMVESEQRGRTTPDNIFSKLFEFESPEAFYLKYGGMRRDSELEDVLARFRTEFGISRPSSNNPIAFYIYSTPPGPGKVTRVGPGVGHWRTYDVSDGLSGNSVRAIFQDQRGDLWVGTSRSLGRFDGQAWTVFTARDGLAGSFIKSIFEDRDNLLWVGTDQGVNQYDGKTWTSFTEQNGLTGHNVFSISQGPEGHIRVHTDRAENLFDGKTWTTSFIYDDRVGQIVRSVFRDRNNTVWIGTPDDVYQYDGTTWKIFAPDGHLPNAFSIFQAHNGDIWFGFRGDKLGQYDGRNFRLFLGREDGFAGGYKRAIFQDRKGHIWIGAETGVSRYDGQTFTTFTRDDGLASNFLNAIFQDREGYFWFGTSAGLNRYDETAFTHFTRSDGLASDRVTTLIQDRQGSLWITMAGGGIQRYDGETFHRFGMRDGLSVSWLYASFMDRDGNLWFGTGQGGVIRYDGREFNVFTPADGLASLRVLEIFQDRDGNLWFGTKAGVSRFDGQQFQTFTTADGIAGNAVSAICQDREGTMWFGTDGGVCRYDGRTFHTFTTKDGLADNTVKAVLLDHSDNLWFGTADGVSKFAPGSGQSEQTWTTFTTRDGLVYNDVQTVLQDRNGHLWFGTSGGGVSRFDGKVFQSLTDEDGLASNNVWDILQDREGNIWFATLRGGLTRYRQPEPFPPSIRINAVVADRRYEQTSELELPSTVGLITFTFAGANLKTRSEAMVYRYRLSGYETEWKSTRNQQVAYQDLPTGGYTFEVQAVDRDLVYSKQPATVALVVHLPYERIGLFSALGIAVLLIAWQTVRVIRRDRVLQASNIALSDANKDLFALTQELQRDRAVERVRAQVQGMEQAADFDGVLSLLGEDLKTVGLSFDTCGIDVLEKPVEKPTMAHFETSGFHYTTYTIDPEGQVLQESYTLTAPFPDVIAETLERFIVGDPWQGTSSGTAILEVPIGQYGRLRLTASDHPAFTESETETLQDFASAIALGYTRYLDFVNLEAANQEIQAQTERKSAFLASMSHELRTPMNAIIGFTRMVLRRSGDALPDQQKENLNKVTQSADHLLELINSLLDLSKIAAGQMDVDASPFSVKKLIASCCSLVEPLTKPNVNLNHEVSDEADKACTDENKLRHVIGNLLSNAVKFTDRGEVSVQARTSHDQLLISVADTGIGMPKEALSTIFDEFQQVKGSEQKQKGTGLGLAITKQYTELLSGTISVESEVGKGTTFTAQIPIIYPENKV